MRGQRRRGWLQHVQGHFSVRVYLGIYVPLCFPTSFPFCNRSVRDYHSSSLHHSPPCTGIRECARGGESLLACLSLLSLSTLAVERETPSGFSFKIDPHERLSCRLRPCIPPSPSLSPSFSFPFFLKNQTLLESKAHSESQAILGVYQKENLGMFKSNSLRAEQPNVAKEPRCATGERAVRVRLPHAHAFK